MRPTPFCVLVFSLVLISPAGARQVTQQLPAQTPNISQPVQVPTQEQVTQGVALLQQSVASQTVGASIANVTLSGTVTVTTISLPQPGKVSSKTESGTVVMTATATGQSQVVYNLPSGTRTEAQDYSVSPPTGSLTGSDGVSHSFHAESLMALHPAWFLPALVAEAGLSSNYKVALIGQEVKNGAPLEHLLIWQDSSGAMSASTTMPRRPGQVDVYLDPTSNLPAAMDFIVPVFLNDPKVTPMRQVQRYGIREIRFSDYRQVQGRPIAFHIQVYGNSTLASDIQLSSASLN